MTHPPLRRVHRGPRRGALTVALVAGLIAASCSAQGGKTTTSTSAAPTAAGSSEPTPTEPSTDEPASAPTPLEWESCDGPYECADLEVPLDYEDPGGDTITIALIREPATDADERLGSIIMNPGGPGGSAIDLVKYSLLPGDLTARFDIVGFDPRGVGRSSPLDCHTHLQDIYDADPTMEDNADKNHFLEVSQSFVDECEETAGAVLSHLGTVNVAHDMDRVRIALGDDQVNYVGYSYGTSIGQQYARLYPDKVRTMVLDGVVDQTNTGLEGALGQAKGFHGALKAFTTDCDATDCGLAPSAEAVVDEVIAAAEKTPIPSPRADRPATPGVITLALAQALYAEFLWPTLVDALAQAQRGDGSGLVDLADEYLGRNRDGSYANGFEIYFAVSCLDSEWPSDPEEIFAAAKDAEERFPRIGEGLINDYVRCALWPVEPQPLEPITSDLDGLPPVLVISTTGDPATPYESGVAVAEQVPGAILITNEGEGHTIFGQGKGCVDNPVTEYILEASAPREDIVCR